VVGRILAAHTPQLVAPETLFAHLPVLLHDLVERQLFARLVWARCLSVKDKDASFIQLALALAQTRDSRVLGMRMLMSADTFEGNPRRSHKRSSLRRVASPWFSIISWTEKTVLGSSCPELFSYFRLSCASGLIFAGESSYSFSGPRFAALDCAQLSKECHFESEQTFRALVRACLVPLLRDILAP
jgi:hypothetical protein